MRRYSDGSRNAMLGVKGIWEAHGPLRENSRGKLQNVVRNSRADFVQVCHLWILKPSCELQDRLLNVWWEPGPNNDEVS